MLERAGRLSPVLFPPANTGHALVWFMGPFGVGLGLPGRPESRKVWLLFPAVSISSCNCALLCCDRCFCKAQNISFGSIFGTACEAH